MTIDNWLINWFWLPRPVLLDFCGELRPTLQCNTARSQRLLVPTQVLTMGSWQHQHCSGSWLIGPECPSQPCGTEWSEWHLCLSNSYTMLLNRPTLKHNLQQRPNVMGTIDCTQIAIKALSWDTFVFVYWKHFHSINVQIICDMQMKVTKIVAH